MLITVKMPEWVLSEKNVCNCTFVVAGMVALGYSYQAIVVWRISVARRCVYAHGYVEPSQGWLCCFDSCFVHANVRFSAGHSVATAAQRSGCRSGHPVAIAAQPQLAAVPGTPLPLPPSVMAAVPGTPLPLPPSVMAAVPGTPLPLPPSVMAAVPGTPLPLPPA